MPKFGNLELAQPIELKSFSNLPKMWAVLWIRLKKWKIWVLMFVGDVINAVVLGIFGLLNRALGPHPKI